MGISIRPTPPQVRVPDEEAFEQWKAAQAKAATPPPLAARPTTGTTGITSEQIDEMMQAARTSYSGTPESRRARVMGAARDAIPWSDELYGLGAAVVPGGRGFADGREYAKATMDAAIEGHEGDALIGALAGGAVIPFGAAARATSLGGRMAAGAKAGGVMGAATGSGLADGGVKERVQGGVTGGVASSLLGALFPALMAAGKGVVTMMGRPRGATPSGVEYRYAGPAVTGIETREDVAADKFLEALTRGGKTPEDLAFEAASRVGREKPITALEVGGENMRGLGEAVASVPGKGKQIISDALEARRGTPFRTEDGGAYARTQSDLETGMGLTGGSTSEGVEEIVHRRAATARPLYEEAFRAGAVVDPRLPELLKRPSAQNAVNYARRLAQEGGETLRLPDEGGPMDLRALHHVKLALDDAIAASKLDTSTGPTMRARMIETRNQIREILRANDSYRKASDIWAGESALRDALEEGAAAVESKAIRAADIRRGMQSLSDGEKAMFRQGALNSLLAETGDVADGGNIARRLAGNPNKRDRLRAMFDSDAEFDTFLLKQADEDAMVVTDRRVLGGSPTARRLAAQDDLGDMPAAQTIQQVVQSPGLMATMGIPFRTGYDAMRRRYIEGTAEELAPLLVAGSGPDAMPFPEMLERLALANERIKQSAARATTSGRLIGQQTGRASGERSRKKPND